MRPGPEDVPEEAAVVVVHGHVADVDVVAVGEDEAAHALLPRRRPRRQEVLAPDGHVGRDGGVVGALGRDVGGGSCFLLQWKRDGKLLNVRVLKQGLSYVFGNTFVLLCFLIFAYLL